MSRQRKKKYLSSRCRHTSSNPIFHFFYTIQLWGHKEKTVAASGTGRKKKAVEHCLDTEGFSLFKIIQPMFLPILYTVLTSILPLFVAALSLLSWHLLHPSTFLLRTNIVTIFSTKCQGPGTSRAGAGTPLQTAFFLQITSLRTKRNKKNYIALFPLSWHLK